MYFEALRVSVQLQSESFHSSVSLPVTAHIFSLFVNKRGVCY